MMKRWQFLLLWMIFLLALAACAPPLTAQPPTVPPLMSMTFMAGYKPQANLPFVGAYVAKEKGFFQREGLDVTIEHSAGQGEHLQLLTAGKIQVTTQDAAVLLQRRADPGLPLVSIALIGQRGQQAYAALASSGIQTPKDWEGRMVGYKGTPPPDLFALLKAAGADADKVSLVNVGFDPRILTEGKVDVYPLFKSNEPYLIRSWGYELTLWDAADYGVPTLGLTYVTTESILQEQPEVLRRFLKAALEGIRYAEENPAEAVEIVLKYTGPQADPQHMRYMLETELRDAKNPLTEKHGYGWQTLEQWSALTNMLVEAGIIQPLEVERVFTTELLP
ncbi:ABC transporter substrate-binding protein [Bellilinea sp.]|uniref:ABC transporter substrate-binding protein n=1 Tax=Bellilinea sp. TaxID=2838785 RepID=UPI002ADD671B|nr:ABC transporter substrate-binding protein [Bellilinea sp.]